MGLAASPAEMAVGPLVHALGDPNLDVRKAAVQSHSAWADHLDEVGVALASMLE